MSGEEEMMKEDVIETTTIKENGEKEDESTSKTIRGGEVPAAAANTNTYNNNQSNNSNNNGRIIVHVVAPKGPMKLTLRREVVVDDDNDNDFSNKTTILMVHDVDIKSPLINKIYKGDILLSIDNNKMKTIKDIADYTKATNHHEQRIIKISRQRQNSTGGATTTTTTQTTRMSTRKATSATKSIAAVESIPIPPAAVPHDAITAAGADSPADVATANNASFSITKAVEKTNPSTTTTTTTTKTTIANTDDKFMKVSSNNQHHLLPSSMDDPSETTAGNLAPVVTTNNAAAATARGTSSSSAAAVTNRNLNDNNENLQLLLQPQSQLKDRTESGTMTNTTPADEVVGAATSKKDNEDSSNNNNNLKIGLNPMSKIIISPYEKDGNESAEIGEHEFEIVKKHFQTKSDESIEIFGAGLATNVIKATNQIELSDKLYDSKWNQTGIINGVQFGWLPNAIMLLLLLENRLQLQPEYNNNNNEGVLATIIKDLGVNKILWDALREYDLQYKYPKLFVSLSLFAFQKHKLISMKCAIFAARAYRCVVLLSPAKNNQVDVAGVGKNQKKRRREMSNSLYEKFTRCCEIMNDNIKVNEKGLISLQNELKTQQQQQQQQQEEQNLLVDSSSLLGGGGGGDHYYPTQTYAAKASSKMLGAVAEKRRSSSLTAEQPPQKKKRGRGRGGGLVGKRQKQQKQLPLSLDSVSSTTTTSSSLLLVGGDNNNNLTLDPIDLEKYRQMKDTFENRYKQIGEEWNVMKQKLKIRNEKRRVAEIRQKLLEELKHK